MANKAAAILNVIQVKNRPALKPMPLIAANAEQAAAVAEMDELPVEVAENFWPGPLTVLLPARKAVAPALVNAKGQLAIRISASPAARCLAAGCGFPITSSSANLSGFAPAGNAASLDSTLAARLADSGASFALAPGECGAACANGGPSTIIEIIRRGGKPALKIIRHGAIGDETLKTCGLPIV